LYIVTASYVHEVVSDRIDTVHDEINDSIETQTEIKNDIEDILNHRVEESEFPTAPKDSFEFTEIHEEPVHTPEPTPVVEVQDEPKSYTQQPTYAKVSKPVVNVDVDSVVVHDQPEKSEDFFDDFFGSEDE
jgi:hypothetical protein